MTAPEMPEPGTLAPDIEKCRECLNSVERRRSPYIPGTVNPGLAGPVSLYADGYERGVEVAKRSALLGHLLCALSGAAVGLLIGWLL